ncbi:MAG: CBS domain-containing protein, partial [Euryarchaeota archaeon]
MLAGPSGLPETSVMRLATTSVVAVPPTVTVKGLIDTMTRYGFRRLPIVEPERESLVGLVTGRDVLDYLAGERRELLDRRYDGNFLLGLHEPARSIMTTDVYVVTPYDTVRKAVRTMFELDVGALPVVEDRDRLVGIITERDVAMD